VPIKSHGETRWVDNCRRVVTPEYRAWQMMRNRCLNPKAIEWRYYGGRGISITPDWSRFENFLADMGRRPSSSLTLDRIDGNGPYCKENCRWATREVQSRNRPGYLILSLEKARRIRFLYATGLYYQSELAEMFGVHDTSISQIIRGVAWKERAK
jgi:hypothetical protein